MSADVVTLVIPARTEYLILARLALAGIAREARIDQSTLADLKLAVTEACGNAVRHAYPGGTGSVGVAFVVDTDRLVMIVEDQGEGVPLAAALADSDAPSTFESGMGMRIIDTIVDELDVAPGADGRGTAVRMTKYLSAAPA